MIGKVVGLSGNYTFGASQEDRVNKARTFFSMRKDVLVLVRE
jgi:hypothetical protein